jgi:hypothetical protein
MPGLELAIPVCDRRAVRVGNIVFAVDAGELQVQPIHLMSPLRIVEAKKQVPLP